MIRPLVTTLALLAAGACAGCSFPTFPPSFVPLINPLTGVAVAAPVAHIPVTTQFRHGPTVTLVNRSDTPVDARFWVARVDVSKPAGYTDQRTGDRLAVRVEPYELLYTQVGRKGWVTGMNDAVVWVRFTLAGADDLSDPPEPAWFALERPGPYKIEISGAFDPDAPNHGLAYHPLEETTMSPLPRSLWIEHHDGEYAIND